MNFSIYGFVLYFGFCKFPMELRAMPQQLTKLIPIEDWIAFKCRTNDVKPLDKFLGKLRATYDFVFHNSDNVSNIERISNDSNKSDNIEMEKTEKLILLNLPMANNIKELIMSDEKNSDSNDMIEYSNNNKYIPSVKQSSISRISKDNEWLDDIETPEPLSELEIVDDDNIDRSVETVTQQPGYQLQIAFARAFGKWLGSILGFTREAYLKLTHSTI